MEVGAVFVIAVAVAVRLVASVFDGDVEGGTVVAVAFENGSGEAKVSRGTMFLDDLSRESVTPEVRMSDTE